MMKAVVGNPVMLVKRERAVKKARVMPNDEHRKAINSLRETNYYLWRQIQIYFSSGARESELQRLRKEDMNLTTQEARYDILKGDHIVTDFIRPIPNAALQLWKEVYNEANDGDFLFSRKRKPGPNPVRRDQFGKAWKRHVKGTAKSRRKENSRSKNFKIEKINVPIDLQTLRHLFATEMMDKLDREYNGSKDVGKGLGHVNGKLVEMVYDKENKNRKDAKIKRKAGLF